MCQREWPQRVQPVVANITFSTRLPETDRQTLPNQICRIFPTRMSMLRLALFQHAIEPVAFHFEPTEMKPGTGSKQRLARRVLTGIHENAALQIDIGLVK